MKIGINGLYLIPGGVGGTEIYLRSLVDAFSQTSSGQEFVLFLAEEASREMPQRGIDIVTAPVAATNRPARLWFEQARLPALCTKHSVDVLLNPGFTGPFRLGRPMVTVIHDLQFRDHPEYFSRADRVGWRFFVDRTIARSARLITISEWTKNRLATHYPGTAGRVDVAHMGVEPEILTSSWTPRREDRYLLTISTLHPHKNLDTLLRAFAAFRRSQPDIRLVIAGLKGHAADQLLALRNELRMGDAVEFTYWIPRPQLRRLLSEAWAFVFPSRYEGFGIPVAEALALGIPTVCSDIAVLDEVAADAALRFPVDSVDALASALRRIASDEGLRGDLSRRGPEQARGFRWSDTAAVTIRSLEAAYNSSKT